MRNGLLVLLSSVVAVAVIGSNHGPSLISSPAMQTQTAVVPSPSPSPSSSRGKNAKAKAVLNYLTSLSNKPDHKIISGQQEELSDLSRYVAPIYQQAGHWPGILGYEGRRSNPVTTAENYWNHGGLVVFTDDAQNPACIVAGTCSSMPSERYPTSIAPYTAAEIATPGTAVNNQFLADLNSSQVPYLTALKKAGVVLLFRFMIEANVAPGNGCWTWWNCHLSGPQYVALFRQAHDYLVYTKGLDNLIWVYAVNAGTAQPGTVLNYYPGPNYVDIVGADEYADSPMDPETYNALVGTGKPFAFTEFGPTNGSGCCGPTYHTYDYTKMLAAIKANFPKTIYWDSWISGWSMTNQNKVGTLLSDSWVVNRDALPRF
jgi:mannan endo-1,4-beta-mannosidase